MNRANILISIAIAVICISFWAFLNQPETEPPWPDRIQGFSFSPMREGQSAITHILPSEEEIDSDLALLADKTYAVRSYTMEGSLAKIPELARKHGLNVTLGAWLDKDQEKNEREIEKLISVARENYRNVVRVIVGNEAVLRGDLTVEQLAGLPGQGPRGPGYTGEHCRALACVVQQQGSCQSRRLHCRAHAALLGRGGCGPGG